MPYKLFHRIPRWGVNCWLHAPFIRQPSYSTKHVISSFCTCMYDSYSVDGSGGEGLVVGVGPDCEDDMSMVAAGVN